MGDQTQQALGSGRRAVDRTQLSVVAVHAAIGVLTSWLAVSIGGSLSTAPEAIGVIGIALLVSGSVAAAILGLLRARSWLLADAAIVLVGFYGATWAFSTSHSVVGDLALAVVAGLPIALGAGAGYPIGEHFASMRGSS